MAAEHTVKAYDEELDRMNNAILEMGGIVEQQLAASIASLARRDDELASRVITDDRRVDALEAEIDQLAVRILALRQPVAVDLRVITASLKIASDLERMGGLRRQRRQALYRHPGNRPHPPHPRDLAHGGHRPGHDQGRARFFPRPRCGARHGGLAAGRGCRRILQQPFPRAAHLHDGGSAPHHAVRAPACSSQRTSSGSAITRPTSPRP